MSSIKIVIGANYGDEGKGLATDYFANKFIKLNKSCIVVCTNGGAQRGHTVTTPEGTRHVFHHFGSGTLCGAYTYIPDYYIVNPMIFRKEYEELVSIGVHPKVYMNYGCRITTPYDMMINQIVEDSRIKKHGSCGLGIWETVVRFSNNPITINDLLKLSFDEFYEVIRDISVRWVSYRLSKYRITKLSPKWIDTINNPEIINNYYDDFKFMMEHVTLCYDNILSEFDGIIFENAQGLMLDEEYGKYSTPSKTGLSAAFMIINNMDSNSIDDIEACYVTRSYLTRHGNGPFEIETDPNEFSYDETNVPNKYQGSIRYSKFTDNSYESMINRITDDIKKNSESVRKYDFSSSIMYTHCNEVKPLIDEYFSDNPVFPVVYESYGKSRVYTEVTISPESLCLVDLNKLIS